MKLLTIVVLLGCIMTVPVSAEEKKDVPLPECRVSVSVDISQGSLSGTFSRDVRAGQEVRTLVGELTVRAVRLNGKPYTVPVHDGVIFFRASEKGSLEVDFEGQFRGGKSVGERNYGVITDTIDDRGVSLTGFWHPRVEGPARWSLAAVLPRGFTAVSEADSVKRVEKAGITEFFFDFPHPAESLSLVATNRYEVTRDRFGQVELEAYFFPEDRGLAGSYLAYVKKYLALYEEMLTPYPYKRFCVVENFLPTGYSLPTYTLLGQEVVRLPFIVETSLGHEILHQWFGNSVYDDMGTGNWTEGLTTYLADHWYEEQKGKGWEYRKQILVNYAAFVNDKNDFPLREFRGRTDQASRAVGYGKAAMVFHMLRRSLGDDAFFDALRAFIHANTFRAASWDDLRSAFEKRSGKNFAAFFRQWLDGKGLPMVDLDSASIRRSGDRYEITLGLTRRNSTAPVELPAVVTFLEGGTKKLDVEVDENRQSVILLADEEPANIVLDGDYDAARLPINDEEPPVIARLAGDVRPLIVLPLNDRERYEAVIDAFVRKGGTERQAAAVTDAEVKASSLVVLGRDNPVLLRLFGRTAEREGGFTISVRRNPWNAEKIVAMIDADSREEAAAAFEKIFHYNKYSDLAFEQGKNISKKIGDADRGIIVDLRSEPAVLDLSAFRKLSSVIDTAAAKKIVYVGEYHDRFSHHDMELRIIRLLHRKNPRLAVGMEMFQRPFQKTLDAYLEGTLDEREFLKQSEYFKRWGFDYNLYKPILDFCRTEKIPVVALNLRREITEKVSKKGMDSLTAEERKELPRETDFSDQEYRDRLRRTFEQHRNPDERSFDFFLQAQVLWDETMAESIDDYLRRNPDRQMVVVAGGGHISYRAGIPKRTYRRNGLPYVTILNDADPDPDAADYIILPQPLDGMTAPKLMVLFTEREGKLVFADFSQGSPAKNAGLKTGDILLSLDGSPVKNVDDVKLALFFKKKGDAIRITVLRKRFFLGSKEVTVEVKF